MRRELIHFAFIAAGYATGIALLRLMRWIRAKSSSRRQPSSHQG